MLVAVVAAGIAIAGAGTAGAAEPGALGAVPAQVTPPGAIPVGCGPATKDLAAAIAAAPSGATVKVCPGTYTGTITLTKPITLLGAQSGVDARSGRTDLRAESVVDGRGGSGFTVAGGVSNVRIDGFTISNATQTKGASTGGVLAFDRGSGITITNNVITRFSFGVNMNSNGQVAGAVTRNRFAENNGEGGQAGVFLCCGPANNLTISDNLFTGHDGNAAAAVNTAGDPTSWSTPLRIERNQSVDDATFAVVTNVDGLVVANNQVVRRPTATTGVGTGILVGGATKNVKVTGNVLTGGAKNGISVGQAFSPVKNTGLTVTGNTVVDRLNGIRFDAQTSGTVSGNTVAQSTGVGILLEGAANAGVTVTGNRSFQNAASDCTDQSKGTRTAGTANTWTGNLGIRSTPPGLCRLF
ncbi:right-handed parallel beta-helix repeat-containing protein [Pseudonocardia sp. NPDC049154]|uniref:right-handed parallel beta-helix repeat-containing protein n=1 Tax=Pseudonocardia sp. NPDC049154 TaxID=3155501 RepID=UPI0033E746C8